MLNHLKAVLVIFIAAAAVGDVCGAEPAKPDGNWIVQSILRDPREKGTGEGAGFQVKIRGDHVTVASASGEVIGAFLIKTHHPAQGPEQLDMWADESGFGKPVEQILKEPPVLAIYELKSDTLRVCWAPLEKRKRPTEFASKPKSGHTLVLLKRAK